jgi:hypothetical protein
MLDASDDVLAEIAKADDKLIDGDFFQLISRLAETALMGGDRESAVKLNELQKKLIPLTTFGSVIQEQSKEVEAAMQSLRDLGENLTQEKLLDLFLAAPTELRLNVLVSMTRQGLDYSFFQMLTNKIDTAQGEERQKLIALREHVLNLTKQIDEEMAKRVAQARQIVEALSKAPDVVEATKQNLAVVDDFFLRAMNEAMENARKAGDLEKIGKLQQIAQVLQEASAPPEEYALIEDLVNTDNPAELKAKLEANQEKVNEAFLEATATLIAQAEDEDENQEFKKKLEELYSQALKISMQKNM